VEPSTRERLFGYEHAFDNPVTLWITVGLAVVLAVAPIIFLVLSRLGKISPDLCQELFRRYYSWLVLVPLMLVPVLLGAAWTIAGVAILSLLCYREFARATGLFREKTISLVVVLGILAITFSVADHWYGLFVALIPITAGTIAAAGILADQPKGYIQRVALGVFGFSLFGSALGHLGYMANDKNYRPIILMIFVAVEANDVFAYIVGKSMGRRKLAPNTSPKKTVAGAVGAVVLTTALVYALGSAVFAGERVAKPAYLVALGMIISIIGQLGDLMLSSIKRDLGIKDMGATIPGHGGLLDRFDSLILVSPGVFHFVGYLIGFGLYPESTRIFTGASP
jgi:phosphatidate cytidylyltransferase